MNIPAHPPLTPSIAAGPAWAVTLGVAAIAGTLASACAMPFVALSTLAAVTMPRRQALAAVTLMWLSNQLLGFTLLGFPHTQQTFGWGLVLGLSSLAALMVARRLTVGREQGPVRLLGTLAAAFLCYEAGIFAFADLLGLPCPFTLSVIAQVALNDAIWFAALYPLHLLLARLRPNWFAGVARRGHAW
jgi:hypothetical protein